MLSDEEKNSMELDIEAKYVGRTEKEFLNNITYAECLYILDTKNKYCDDIKNLSLLKIVEIVNKQSKEIEELNKSDASKEQSSMNYYNLYKDIVDKIEAKIEEIKEEVKTCFLYGKAGCCTNNCKEACFYYDVIDILQRLLEGK